MDYQTEPLTPDFYDYDWQPIERVTIDGDFVITQWPGGKNLRSHCWWLRECVVAPGATDPATREGTLDPAMISADLAVTSAQLSSSGVLELAFSDGFSGKIHPGWLRHVADKQHRHDAWLPTHEIWTASTLAVPPTFDGQAVLNDDDTLTEWLRAMVRFGCGRLAGLPVEMSTVLDVTNRIGAQRDTNFGLSWSVKAEILGNEENSTANTALRLGPHTDLPTREIPPGYQFLHCLENTVTGGFSTMTDGEAIARHLAAEEPDIHDALASLHWVFFNRSREHDHRWSGPMLDYGVSSAPLSIRAFYPVRAFPDMPDEDVGRAYRSVRRFHQLAADPQFQISYPYQPGDLIGFDNRRLLHGRDSFDAGAGRRHLRGTYMDHDEIHSRLRVLERKNNPGSLEKYNKVNAKV
ncbi:MAG: TauD/TfdA family dioxygenase [Oceanicoccus sp.]